MELKGDDRHVVGDDGIDFFCIPKVGALMLNALADAQSEDASTRVDKEDLEVIIVVLIVSCSK